MDKFPEIEGFGPGQTGGDILSREKELLGEEAAAEFAQTGGLSDSDIDAAAFESNFPALNVDTPLEASDAGVSGKSGSNSATDVNSIEKWQQEVDQHSQSGDSSENAFTQEWKIKNQLAIERRDTVAAAKLKEMREKAKKSIDEFYENYNSKKEIAISQVREEAEKFQKERDESVSGGTAWDRIYDLVRDAGKPAKGVKPADKKRFFELVESLKGDVNAPGAAGY